MRWRPVARPCLSSLPCHGLDTGIEAGAMTVPLFSLRETPWRSHARRAAWPTRRRGRSCAVCSVRSWAGGARAASLRPAWNGALRQCNARSLYLCAARAWHREERQSMRLPAMPTNTSLLGAGERGDAVDVLKSLRYGYAAPGVARRQVTFFCFAKRKRCRVQYAQRIAPDDCMRRNIDCALRLLIVMCAALPAGMR